MNPTRPARDAFRVRVRERMEAAPEGVGSTRRGLTHSSDYGREGLAMQATRVCRACGAHIPRDPQWSFSYYETRLYCNRTCRDADRPDIASDYIVTPSGCWEWQGQIDRNGYGKAYDPNAPKGKRVDWAHRVSYRHHRGQVPEGRELDHVCENTCCINPDHLEPVTRAEHVWRTTQRRGGFDRQQLAARLRHEGLTYAEIAQVLDLSSATGAHAKVQEAIKNGLIDPAAVPPAPRLTEGDHQDIRDLCALGVPQGEVANWYRIDNSQISRICNGRTSGHREGAA